MNSNNSHLSLQQLDDYILDIDTASDLDDVLTVLQKQISGLGFDRFTYWLRWAGGDERKPIGITTYPEHFIEHYIASDYQSHDLIGRISTQTSTPFLWSDIYKRFEMTQVQAEIFDDGKSAGMKSGASVPIHGPNQTQATFSVANESSEKEFDKLFKFHRHELHILASYAHEKIMSLGIDNRLNDLTLTKRETEVLTWVARGKTYWETGQILSIQEDTVKKYMQRIFALLQVNNQPHAIAKAIINGLIIP